MAGRMQEVVCKAQPLADGLHRAGNLLDVAQGGMGGNAWSLMSLQKSRLAVSSPTFWVSQTKLKTAGPIHLVTFTLLISGCGGLF